MADFLPWETNVSVMKAYQDDAGKMHVVAVASDDGTDLQSDQMTEKALTKMASQALSGVPLLDNHQSTFEFGRTVSAQVVTKEVDGKPVRQFVVDLELNADYPEARALFKDIKNKRCNKQLSIGGKLNLKNVNAVSVTMTSKGLVRKINDVDLDHIACTRARKAANPRTGFVDAIMKSIDDADAWEKFKESDETNTDNLDFTSSENTMNVEMEKDVTAGLGLLSSIGKLLRNGGTVMGNTLKDLGQSSEGDWPLDEPTTPVVEDEPVLDAEKNAPPPEASGLEEMAPEAPAPVDTGVAKTEPEPEPAPAPEGEPDFSDIDFGDDFEQELAEDALDDESSEDLELGMDEIMDEGDEPAFAFSPEEEIAAKTLMAARRRRIQKQKEMQKSESEEVILRDIAFLMGAKDKVRARLAKSKDYKTETTAMRAALHNIRYLISKQILKSSISGVAAEMAHQVVGEGTFAPNDESGAPANRLDNENAVGDQAFGTKSVTDQRTMEDPRSEPEVDAPKGSNVGGQAARTAGDVSRLPQADDEAEFGKSLDVVLKKSLDATSQMVLKSVSKIADSQNQGFAEVNKALSSMVERIERVEKAGGVRHSGPRGANDNAIITKSNGNNGSAFSGIFTGATRQATRGM